MINVLTSAGSLALAMLALTAPPAPAAAPKTRSAVRTVMASYDKRLFAGDARACPMMDKRGETQFVGSVRKTMARHIRDCPDAVTRWGRLLRDGSFPLSAELRYVARARVTGHGNRATLFDNGGRVCFVRVSRRWLVDWVSG